MVNIRQNVFLNSTFKEEKNSNFNKDGAFTRNNQNNKNIKNKFINKVGKKSKKIKIVALVQKKNKISTFSRRISINSSFSRNNKL